MNSYRFASACHQIVSANEACDIDHNIISGHNIGFTKRSAASPRRIDRASREREAAGLSQDVRLVRGALFLAPEHASHIGAATNLVGFGNLSPSYGTTDGAPLRLDEYVLEDVGSGFLRSTALTCLSC